MNFEDLSAFAATQVAEGVKHPAKEKWALVHRDMRTHILGEYPAHLINARRPNEAAEVHEFRKAVYEPITRSSFLAAEDALHRVFIDAQSCIRAPQDILNFLFSSRFLGYDFIGFVEQVLFRRMLLDPNAIAIVLKGSDGLPTIEIVPSSKIVNIAHDFVIWHSHRDSDFDYYYAASSEVVVLLTVGFVMGRATYKSTLVQEHNLPTPHIPWVVLGGSISDFNDSMYYESFLSAAVPFGNDCLKQYSDWYASLVTASYAIREVRPVDCDAPGCRGGWIYDDSDEPKHKCSRCHGTGYVPSFSPYGVYIQGKDDPLTGQPAKPPIIFHTPPIEPLQYGERSWQDMYRQMRRALHLQYVDEAQSGLAKKIDREPAYAQLLKIRDHIYDHIIYNLVDSISRQYDPVLYIPPAIYKPSQFDIRNQEELMSEISQLRNSKAPRAVIIELTKELIRNRYSGDDLLLKKHEFLVANDPLYDSDAQQLAFLFSSGAITREDVLFHIHAPGIIDEIVAHTNKIDPEQAYLIYQDPAALRRRIFDIIRSRGNNLTLNIPELA